MRKKKKKSRKIPKYELGTPPTEPQINYARTDATNVAGFPGYEGEYEAPNPNRKEDWIGNALVGSIFAPFLGAGAAAYGTRQLFRGLSSQQKGTSPMGKPDLAPAAKKLEKFVKGLEKREDPTKKFTNTELQEMLRQLKSVNAEMEKETRKAGVRPSEMWSFGKGRHSGVKAVGKDMEELPRGIPITRTKDRVHFDIPEEYLKDLDIGLPDFTTTISGPQSKPHPMWSSKNNMGFFKDPYLGKTMLRGPLKNKYGGFIPKYELGVASSGIPLKGMETFFKEYVPSLVGLINPVAGQLAGAASGKEEKNIIDKGSQIWNMGKGLGVDFNKTPTNFQMPQYGVDPNQPTGMLPDTTPLTEDTPTALPEKDYWNYAYGGHLPKFEFGMENAATPENVVEVEGGGGYKGGEMITWGKGNPPPRVLEGGTIEQTAEGSGVIKGKKHGPGNSAGVKIEMSPNSKGEAPYVYSNSKEIIVPQEIIDNLYISKLG